MRLKCGRCMQAQIDFNILKINFNYKGLRSFGAQGYWSAAQNSLRSTGLCNIVYLLCM